MTKPLSNAEIVLEAIQDLHAREQIATRETLSELTGLKLSIIDDRLGYLVDDGKIHRVQRGVFVPAAHHSPARPITRSMLADGTTVLEIGDEVLHLSPRESRMLGEVMAGSAQAFAVIEIGHQAAYQSNVLGAAISDLRREVSRLAQGEAA